MSNETEYLEEIAADLRRIRVKVNTLEDMTLTDRQKKKVESLGSALRCIKCSELGIAKQLLGILDEDITKINAEFKKKRQKRDTDLARIHRR